MVEKIHLIIDDMRTLNCDVVVRTAAAGKLLLHAIHENIECLYIDHDLGFDENGVEMNGYDIIKWAIKNRCLPDKIQIVSQNPVGRNNIGSILLHAGYTTSNMIDFQIN